MAMTGGLRTLVCGGQFMANRENSDWIPGGIIVAAAVVGPLDVILDEADRQGLGQHPGVGGRDLVARWGG